MKRLVIGIFAHVDSGKTTLSEAMLYCSGAIRKLGRVDHGDAFLDNDTLERDRGITIFSKQAQLHLGECEITLLDTPGHVDFSPEAERTLSVLDYAILVISASEGVQSHTETLWKLLKQHNVPVFIYVNKTDLPNAGKTALLSLFQKKLDGACMEFGDGFDEESAAVCSDELFEEFENGAITDGAVARAVKARRMFPCRFGSALKNEGVSDFLSDLVRYTLPADACDKFAARVYKITHDETGARLTHMRITGGVLTVKDILSGMASDGEWSEKADQIRIYSGTKYQLVTNAEPGMVVAVVGLSHTYPGEGLGCEHDHSSFSMEPVLNYKVIYPPHMNKADIMTKLRRLEEEEPQLKVRDTGGEITVSLMGEVQLEIIKSLMKSRFDIDVEFGEGRILYRETIRNKVEGVGHFEPLRHYAEVHLILEPGERGSGLEFSTDCSEDELERNWQRLILTHLEERTHPGVLTGSPITDMKITLAAGRAHKKHTEGGDFRQATYRAVRQGLRRAECVLLEPWYDFILTVPSQSVGRAMTDLQRMGATFSSPEVDGESSVIRGTAPVAAMRKYHVDVTDYTRGRGRLFCSLRGYEPCADSEAVIGMIGYDPDADVDNPADSVFCSHGAGHIVSWKEVEQHMHLESALKKTEKSPEEIELTARAERYVRMVADDKELLSIFERTYGPVKTDKRRAMMPVRHERDDSKYKGTPQPQGPEYLLVDGYNVIFAWDELKKLAEVDLNDARNRLIDILINYRAYRQCELILVYDAYKVKKNPGSIERMHNINVVYTKEAETADMYIEKVTNELGRKHRVRVVTSDGLEQVIILGHGALRVSSQSFYSEVKEAENAIKRVLDAQAAPTPWNTN